MTHRQAIDTDVPENICDDIRQLPWSWAKARLLVDFEVVTLVSWPLSQRDETYGHHSVKTGKVYHTGSRVWQAFLFDFTEFLLVDSDYILVFAYFCWFFFPLFINCSIILLKSVSECGSFILFYKYWTFQVINIVCTNVIHFIPKNGNKMAEIILMSSTTWGATWKWRATNSFSPPALILISTCRKRALLPRVS